MQFLQIGGELQFVKGYMPVYDIQKKVLLDVSHSVFFQSFDMKTVFPFG